MVPSENHWVKTLGWNVKCSWWNVPFLISRLSLSTILDDFYHYAFGKVPLGESIAQCRPESDFFCLSWSCDSQKWMVTVGRLEVSCWFWLWCWPLSRYQLSSCFASFFLKTMSRLLLNNRQMRKRIEKSWKKCIFLNEENFPKLVRGLFFSEPKFVSTAWIFVANP